MNDKVAALKAKQQADKQIIDGIDKADVSGPFDWLVKRAAQAALLAKLIACLGNNGREEITRDEARRISQELHSLIVHKFQRCMMI